MSSASAKLPGPTQHAAATADEASRDSVLPLSVVILTKNEEQNIQRCIQALSWAGQIVVIDDGSTDRTVDLAQSCGAEVVQNEFVSFASQRNWAMQNVKLNHDWVLHLDADEVATPKLCDALRETLTGVSDQAVAFRMCRKTMLLGRWLKYSDGFPVWIMRLVRAGYVRFEDQGHGEVAVPEVDGEMGTIREPFLHYAFSKGLADWIERHNRYSTREAQLELQQFSGLKWKNFFSNDRSVRRTALRSLSRRLPLRPLFRFLYQYILKRGFLDGRAGWTFSRMMAMYEGWIVMKRNELRRERRRDRAPAGKSSEDNY